MLLPRNPASNLIHQNMGLLVREGHNGHKIYSMTLGQNIIVLEIVFILES